ncbi:hypothetical protein PybrP1_005836, partial [[Pythium] brassicae (nom. inval.)]
PRAIEGSVPYYERHFVVVDALGRAEDWPKKLEFSDHIISTYAKSLNAIESQRGGDAKSSPLKITAVIPYTGDAACTGGASGGHSAVRPAAGVHDVLVFPDNIRVHEMSAAQIDAFVHEGAHGGANWTAALEKLNLRHSPVEKGFHLLVCAHANRDFRCACAGPKMLEWLRQVARERGAPLHLWAASHYGGHRYAGNCVAYPSGDWFGMINSKEDAQQMVAALLDNAPLRLVDQWRGRIQMTKAEQVAALQHA